MTPKEALIETPGNWAIDNATIISIRTKWHSADDDATSEFHTEIRTTGENSKLIAKYATRKLLKLVFGNKLFK
jgi:hypothetical protein